MKRSELLSYRLLPIFDTTRVTVRAIQSVLVLGNVIWCHRVPKVGYGCGGLPADVSCLLYRENVSWYRLVPTGVGQNVTWR